MIHVFGHPRSGNHYLCHLIETNDFGPMQQKGNQHHRWPPPFVGEPLGKLFEKGDERFFYIWRNWNDVALSNMAKEKPRRMSVDLSMEVFSSTPWADLLENELIKETLLNRWIMENQRFLTPYECWNQQVSKWITFSENRTDVYIVRYEDLMENFHDTMSNMAQWLGLDRDSFENITKKVDPAGIREGGFR